MKNLFIILSLVCIGNNIYAQINNINEAINRLCEGSSATYQGDCEACKNYLQEGWTKHQKKEYGNAIYQYARAYEVDAMTDKTKALLDDLLTRSERALNQLTQQAIQAADALEEQNQQLKQANFQLRGKDKTIAAQSDSIQTALQQVHKKGRKAEAFRIPSIANRIRRTTDNKAALYLAFYSVLLQKEALKHPSSLEALMEAGAKDNTLSTTIFSSHEMIETMEVLDSNRLLFFTNQQVFVHYAAQNERLPTQLPPPFQYALSKDKKNLALVGQNGKVEVWNLKNRELLVTFQKHQEAIQLCRFSPKGQFFSTANRRGEAYIYPLKGGEAVKIQNLDKCRVYGLEISPDGTRILTRHANGIAKIWNQKGEALYTIGRDELYLHDAQFSPDGKWIVTSNTIGQVRYWNVENGKLKQTLKETKPIKKTYAINSDLCLYHTARRLFVLNEEVKLNYLFEDRILGLEVNPQNDRALVWTYGGGLFQIDLKEKNTIGAYQHRKNILAAQFSLHGKWIVSTSKDGHIKMWDNEENTILNWQLDDVQLAIAKFSADGEHLFLLDANGKKVRKCPLPELIIEKLEQQKHQILDYLKSKKTAFNLQYLEHI